MGHAFRRIRVLKVTVRRGRTMVRMGVTSNNANLVMNDRVQRFVIVARDFTHVAHASATNGVCLLTSSVLPCLISDLSMKTIAHGNDRVDRAKVRMANACNVSRYLFLLRCELIQLRVSILTYHDTTHIRRRLNLIRVFLVSYRNVRTCRYRFNGLVSKGRALLSKTFASVLTCTINVASDCVRRIPLTYDLVVDRDPFRRIARVVRLITRVLRLQPTFQPHPVIQVLKIRNAYNMGVPIQFLNNNRCSRCTISVFFRFLIQMDLRKMAYAFGHLVSVHVIGKRTSRLVLVAKVDDFRGIFVASHFLALARDRQSNCLTTYLRTLSPRAIHRLR